MSTPSTPDTYSTIPELMRIARGTYKRAVDERLANSGLEDLPTASGYLFAYLESDEETMPERMEELGIKKREFSQLVDALVVRGFITREIAPSSGTAAFALTERGRAANDVIGEGVRYVDEELERRLSEAEMAGLRRGLAILGEIKQSLSGPAIRRGLSR